MKRALIYLTLLAGIIILDTSCRKECDLPEDVEKGAILPNKLVIATSGYLTSNHGGTLHIHATHPYAGYFKVRTVAGDGTWSEVDYESISGQYDILGYQRYHECDASFVRDVIQDDINGTVTYQIDITECGKGCDNQRMTENYVLVPKIPASYFVYFQ
jgi:hypothetical protein